LAANATPALVAMNLRREIPPLRDMDICSSLARCR
jgi:hypothetical protein